MKRLSRGASLSKRSDREVVTEWMKYSSYRAGHDSVTHALCDGWQDERPHSLRLHQQHLQNVFTWYCVKPIHGWHSTNHRDWKYICGASSVRATDSVDWSEWNQADLGEDVLRKALAVNQFRSEHVVIKHSQGRKTNFILHHGTKTQRNVTCRDVTTFARK